MRHDGALYEVGPWSLSWDDENYYLIAYDSNEGVIKHFRVDKMLYIKSNGKGIEDADSKSYENIRKYYIDLLIKAIENYIDEAVKRKKTYEQAYPKYNAEFDKQQEKVEELKRELEKIGFFSFSKKKLQMNWQN